MCLLRKELYEFNPLIRNSIFSTSSLLFLEIERHPLAKYNLNRFLESAKAILRSPANTVRKRNPLAE